MDRGLIVLAVVMSEMAVMCAICFYYVRKENREKALVRARRRLRKKRRLP